MIQRVSELCALYIVHRVIEWVRDEYSITSKMYVITYSVDA